MLTGLKKFEDIGISLNEQQISQFDRFTELLLEWNQKMNLTAITDPEEIVLKHYVDSVLLLQSGVVNDGSSVIDVGCGAGFPSIPVKIMNPSLEFTLLDSLNKRLNFLDCVIKELELKNINTLHRRAEEAGQDPIYRSNYDICVARAVAPFNILLEYCIPFLKTEGYFVALKGPDGYHEIESSKNAISKLNMKVEKIIDTKLPGTEQKRTIIVLKKIGATPAQYPRKAGKPSKNPL